MFVFMFDVFDLIKLQWKMKGFRSTVHLHMHFYTLYTCLTGKDQKTAKFKDWDVGATERSKKGFN